LKWISTDDELPEIYHKVLFHWIDVGENNGIAVGCRVTSGWNIYNPFDSFHLYKELYKVTYWAELPEFPNNKVCKHDNIALTPMYQCEDCKKFVEMS
jgi:hypothetical protein